MRNLFYEKFYNYFLLMCICIRLGIPLSFTYFWIIFIGIIECGIYKKDHLRMCQMRIMSLAYILG